MNYEIIGLLFEVIFLALGVYVYLFSIGKIEVKGQAASNFRKQNGTLLRYLSLALIAIMVVNIYLHIMAL